MLTEDRRIQCAKSFLGEVSMLLQGYPGAEVDMFSGEDCLVIRCWVRDSKMATDVFVSDEELSAKDRGWSAARKNIILAFDRIGHPLETQKAPWE